MILICYDGSEDAKAAIKQGAALLAGQPATVLTVWEPFVEVMAQSYAGLGLSLAGLDSAEIDEAAQRNAQERAEEGAGLARDAGLEAQPRVTMQESTTAAAIIAQAREVDAAAILMGSRGLTGIKSMLLGSVSHAVIQHADRPVVVVPSPEVASAREAR
jgi:nucleotide-binding universal stress UspA family protein